MTNPRSKREARGCLPLRVARGSESELQGRRANGIVDTMNTTVAIITSNWNPQTV